MTQAGSLISPAETRAVDDDLSIDTALFQVAQNNSRTQTGTSGEHTDAGKVRIRGAEVSATGHVTSNWPVMGGMNYMSMRYAANTNVIRVSGYTRWDATIAWHQPLLRIPNVPGTDQVHWLRMLLLDKGNAIQRLNATNADETACRTLVGSDHNLLRLWSET